MNSSFLFVIPIVVVIAVLGLLYFSLGGKKRKENDGKTKIRDRAGIVREANRRLSQNPRDAESLKALADVYYQEKQFDKSLKSYELLVDLCATNKELDEFEITLKYAVSALKTKHLKEAYKSFVIARTMRQDVFEVNFNLGFLEYHRGNYEKSTALLSQAQISQPDHPETIKYFGLSLHKIGRYDGAAKNLRRFLELDPENKESLFALGQCYYELNQSEHALKILKHLRADPKVGAHAALYAGTIHLKLHAPEEAAMDFEIGLRHESLKPEVSLELKYRLANTYVELKNLGQALKYMEEIYRIQPDYRDIATQIGRYRELSLNSNLQTYLLGTTSEFVSLCRKLSAMFFPDAGVKIVDIALHKSEYADLLAEVNTSRWEDLVLFRYIRTSGNTGDLALRDMYARMKEVKSGRGFCVNAGGFSDTARQFVEARLIDLVDKSPLNKMLNRLTTFEMPAE